MGATDKEDYESDSKTTVTTVSDLTLFVETKSLQSTPSEASSSKSHYNYETSDKHKVSYNPDWEKEWPWLLFRDCKGMFCSVCINYSARSRSKSGIWVSELCTQFRKGEVKKHSDSDMHKGAKKQEALAAVVSAHEGIE